MVFLWFSCINPTCLATSPHFEAAVSRARPWQMPTSAAWEIGGRDHQGMAGFMTLMDTDL